MATISRGYSVKGDKIVSTKGRRRPDVSQQIASRKSKKKRVVSKGKAAMARLMRP